MMAQLNYWALPVTDPDRAARFFAAVFGWKFSEPGAAGGRHVLDSDPWGGLAPADGTVLTRSTIAFSTEDPDALMKLIEDNGGTTSEIPSNGDYGRWIECTDDQGTPFALFAKAEST